jgi:hypothetical protein
VVQDLGFVFTDSSPELTHSFVIKNETRTPVTFTDVLKSCNCTTITLGKYSLQPGEQTRLEMKVKVLSKTKGAYKATATLITDKPHPKSIAYTLAYRVYNRIEFDSPSINLGNISPESVLSGRTISQDLEFDIYSRSSEPEESIEKLDAGGGLLVTQGQSREPEYLEQGNLRKRRILATIQPITKQLLEFPGGGQTSSVNVVTSSAIRASVTVSWEVNNPVEVSPNPFSFGYVSKDASGLSKNIIIRDTENTAFRILGSRSDSQEIRLTHSEKSAAPSTNGTPVHIINVRLIPAPNAAKYIKGKIVFLTDHPLQKEIQLTWTAIFDDRK